eukprot:3672697-Rhodomonas_salina.1
MTSVLARLSRFATPSNPCGEGLNPTALIGLWLSRPPPPPDAAAKLERPPPPPDAKLERKASRMETLRRRPPDRALSRPSVPSGLPSASAARTRTSLLWRWCVM